jgi:hypothetical protein
VRPLYLDQEVECELIEMLNDADTAWRDTYETPLDAAQDLLPEWYSRHIGEVYEDNADRYDELDFNED